ncbi:MAG TPA: hypothetical protein VHI32_12430 [Burkholderiales bacterium]|jgi:hypothetical protein|nr:hypothetical protein [Burkholderiales bacterium]
MNRRFLTVIVFASLATIAGCGEREQVVVYKDGKYQGKPDARPWDNAPPANGSAGWKQGDHSGWENQLRARSAGQNENRRIGH